MLNLIKRDNRKDVLSVMLASAAIGAFNNKPGWKMNAEGTAVEMRDGNPIWVDANGGETILQGDTITRLNGEAKTLRTRAETAETKLTAYKGVDPEIALKAIDDIKKIDTKKLIDAGKVDEVRQEVANQFAGQIKERDDKLAERDNTINTMKIDGVFAQSDFIRDSIAMPRDFFEAQMRRHFKVDENGKVQALDKNGNPIYSRKNSSEYASPDEALEIIVEMHPQKDTILKAPDHRGTGNTGGGGGTGSKRSMRRADFEKMSPAAAAEYSTKVATGEAAIVD